MKERVKNLLPSAAVVVALVFLGVIARAAHSCSESLRDMSSSLDKKYVEVYIEKPIGIDGTISVDAEISAFAPTIDVDLRR